MPQFVSIHRLGYKNKSTLARELCKGRAECLMKLSVIHVLLCKGKSFKFNVHFKLITIYLISYSSSSLWCSIIYCRSEMGGLIRHSLLDPFTRNGINYLSHIYMYRKRKTHNKRTLENYLKT